MLQKRKIEKNAKVTHNKTKTRLYSIWSGIKQRCYNQKKYNYQYYGARGIKICNEWKDNFLNFYNWAINNGYQEDLSIDRINNDGNYEPNNCRWTTTKEQNNNMNINHYIDYGNERLTMKQFAEKYELDYHLVKNRVRYGWSAEKILSTPKRAKGGVK